MLNVFDNSAYVRSYDQIKTFTWKGDCATFSKVERLWFWLRPFWKALIKFHQTNENKLLRNFWYFRFNNINMSFAKNFIKKLPVFKTIHQIFSKTLVCHKSICLLTRSSKVVVVVLQLKTIAKKYFLYAYYSISKSKNYKIFHFFVNERFMQLLFEIVSCG